MGIDVTALDPDFITESEAASILGKTISTLRHWAMDRKGPARISVGRRIVYRKSALLSWLISQETDFSKLRRRSKAA
ncbi:hypothetical protein CCC_02288 [Paramagnetospirillum magnetotacticum MS-1]|uniref:Helix-turn-helix domain-containing protein n=1 Tax=Paramagnetospirillum magnetotacticum MS-1 TaxID=272627 RepID=A0A0C2YUN8_PARME|nr:helix-turn-helix domain-containing protein [Paramagnetospirillum magnetotacticum]KIL98838.1 hypothetical protein CCC_02288 [Paramagnetospirillum magnetotacticum MS-1]